MDYLQILDFLAPCGLNCAKCLSHAQGDIKKLSLDLQERLGSFDHYAERFSGFNPAFKNYPAFKELLTLFTQGSCQGCRQGTCLNTACGIITCHQEKGVDFCFQCAEFPCQKSNLDPNLHQRWLTMNQRMKEIGVEAYWEEIKDLPRYR